MSDAAEQRAGQALAGKWGDALAGGWTALPTVVVQHQAELKLDALNFALLSVLASYWWRADQLAHPSRRTLARSLGVDTTTVRRRLVALEKLGYLKRIRGAAGTETNGYDLTGLRDAASRLAADVKERRVKAKARRLLRALERIDLEGDDAF